MNTTTTKLEPDEEWECQVCGYPLGPGDTAVTTDPYDLPDVWCSKSCAAVVLKKCLPVSSLPVAPA